MKWNQGIPASSGITSGNQFRITSTIRSMRNLAIIGGNKDQDRVRGAKFKLRSMTNNKLATKSNPWKSHHGEVRGNERG
jgi:hypothetical protein